MKFESSSIAAALDLKPEAVFCIPHDQTNKTLRGRVDFSGGAGESGVRLVMLEKKPVISLRSGKWVPRSVTQLQPSGEKVYFWVRSVPHEITQVIFSQTKPIVNSTDKTPRVIDFRAPGVHKLPEEELNLEVDDGITREQAYEVGVPKMSEFMLWEQQSTPSEVAETFQVVLPEMIVPVTVGETTDGTEEVVVEEDPTVRRWLDGMEADLEEGDIDEEELTLKLRRIRVEPSSMERTMLEEIGAWEEIEVADPAGQASDPAPEAPVTRSMFGWVLNRSRNASTVPSAPGKLRRIWNILVE